MLINPISSYSSLRGVKYFLVQSLGSGVFFINLIFSGHQNFIISNLILVLAISWKLGIAPFQGWLVGLRETVSWETFFYLNSLQKVIPLFIILKLINFELILLIRIGIFISIFGGLRQVKLKIIFVYSSALSLVWICRGGRFYEGLLYLRAYRLRLFILSFYMENEMSSQWINISKLNWRQGDSVVLILIFLSFSGMPPFIGFYPKILILSILVNVSRIYIFILLLGSSVFVYIYIRLFLTNLSLNVVENRFIKIVETSSFFFSSPLWLGLIFFLLLCVY